MYLGARIWVAWTDKYWNRSGLPGQPKIEIFIHGWTSLFQWQWHNVCRTIITLSMMMSGTHSLAASSGLSTTYPRLLFKSSSRGRHSTLSCSKFLASTWRDHPEKESFILSRRRRGEEKEDKEYEKEGWGGNLPKERQGRLQPNLHLSFLHIQDVPENWPVQV